MVRKHAGCLQCQIGCQRLWEVFFPDSHTSWQHVYKMLDRYSDYTHNFLHNAFRHIKTSPSATWQHVFFQWLDLDVKFDRRKGTILTKRHSLVCLMSVDSQEGKYILCVVKEQISDAVNTGVSPLHQIVEHPPLLDKEGTKTYLEETCLKTVSKCLCKNSQKHILS